MGSFYSTRAWRKTRRAVLIAGDFTCCKCGRSMLGRYQAQVHHRLKVNEHPGAALMPANLQPICPRCHNRHHAPEKAKAFGCTVDGWPLDPRHPWNREAARREAIGAPGGGGS